MASSIPRPAKAYAGKCPICGGPGAHEFRPFCSRRCADVDLSRWLRGAYAIAGGQADADEDGEDSAAGRAPNRPAGDGEDG